MKTGIKLMQKCLIVVMVLLLMPLLLASQTFSEKREQSRSFRLKAGALVQISNKYGNVYIMNWDKDSVRVDVSISVQSKQPTKMMKILSSIDCEMVSSPSYLSARTVFHDNSATFWKDVVAYAGKVVSTSNNLQINYTVYMPSTNQLKIDNKFGNIYLDNQKGRADLTLSNGDLQARDFTGDLKLNLEFGTANLQQADEASLNINYSDLFAQKIGKLTLVSRSSTIDMEEVGSLDVESVRDKITLKNCNSVTGDASFTRLRIGVLGTVCSLTTKYGELRINEVPKSFLNIFVKAEYTDLVFSVSPQASYALDLLYDAKTALSITPSIDNQLKKETINAKYSTIKANGQIGKSDGSQITLTAKAGSVALMNK
ncbi:MAG: hypothetical protein JNL22_08925 [Bacteroidales bacterium]|nr:hypothetical protein [Bacteroidales bacterium]